MNKQIISILFLIGLLTLSACVQEQPSGNLNPLRDTQIFEGSWFKINYPNTWTNQTEGQLAIFTEPAESETNLFQENLIVLRESLSEEMNAQEYVEKSVKQLEEGLSQFQILKLEPVTVNGLEGYQLEYQSEVEGIELGYIQVLLTKNKTGYVIGFTGLANELENNRETFRKMINSFELKQNQNEFGSETIAETESENRTSEPMPVASIEEQGMIRNWREYSKAVYLDNGDWSFAETSNSLIDIQANHTWIFGTQNGTWEIQTITEQDWSNWGINEYGPTRKIILYGWNESVNGPIEEIGDRIDYFWVIYRTGPPEIEEPGQIQIKFGWSYAE
ncbi:MAG: DcrB-related protein [Candidatus Diapherotrites archaeon]|nr:DcrB-related protein [Candidatus Diapherotrites archaeon]